MRKALEVILALLLTSKGAVELQAATVYSGAFDGSAAVAINATFFVAATDEDSILRIYRRETGGAPVQTVDLTGFLKTDARSPETDIEGAAKIGERIYWITSHGRNKNGKKRPSRQRFFATRIATNEHGIQLLPVGIPYQNLLKDLTHAEALKEFDLAHAATLAPKDSGGLNIEGLAATPDNHLLIGFRSPLPEGRALLVPLLNPDEVVEGKESRFGAPIQLHLGGLGIRSIGEWNGEFIIVAGPTSGSGRFKLFRWSGTDATPVPAQVVLPGNLNPESVILYPDLGLQKVQLLSDDSGESENVAAKDSGAFGKISFRSKWISL